MKKLWFERGMRIYYLTFCHLVNRFFTLRFRQKLLMYLIGYSIDHYLVVLFSIRSFRKVSLSIATVTHCTKQ